MKVKVLLRIDKPLANGNFPIWLRITHKRKSSYLSLGHSCSQEEWDQQNERLYEVKPRLTLKDKEGLNSHEMKEIRAKVGIIQVNPLAKVINNDIANEVDKIYRTKGRIEAKEETLSAKKIKGTIKDQSSASSFLSFWEAKNKEMEVEQSYSTTKNYQSSLRILKAFRGGAGLEFSEIDLQLLKNFRIYLANKGNSKNTIHKLLRNFRTILYKAIEEGFMDQGKNPFFTFTLEAQPPKKKERLKVDEIKRIQELDLEEGSLLWHTKNLFLFSFYNAGIRIRDLLQLKWENISKDGRLEYTMGKSDKFRSIKLSEKANAIIIDYKKGKTKTPYIFPFLNSKIKNEDKGKLGRQLDSKTALVNKYLREIAERAGIDKNLTSHIARHSFAQIAKDKKVDLEEIQALLGHSDSKITKAYLDSLDIEAMDETQERILEGL